MFTVNKAGYNSIHETQFQVNWPEGRGRMQLLLVRTPAVFELRKEDLSLIRSKDSRELVDEKTGFLCDFHASQKGLVRVFSTGAVVLFFTEEAPQVYYSREYYCNDWILLDERDQETEAFLQTLSIPFNRPMMLSSFGEVSSMIRDLVQEVHKQGKNHEKILDWKMRTILLKICDLYEIENQLSGKLKRYRSRFQELRDELFLYPETCKTVTELAEKENMSVSYFQHIYKELFNSNVSKDLIGARIEKACYLLTSTAESARSISEKCGYDNYEHFCRQFKEMTGYTPKRYQQRVQ